MNIFIEKYNPTYYTFCEGIMTKQIKLGWIGFPAIVLAGGIAALAVFAHVAWLLCFIILALAMAFSAITTDSLENFKRALRPFNRGRMEFYLSEFADITSNPDLMRDDFLRQKITEYFNALRDGCEDTHEVDTYLRQVAKAVAKENELRDELTRRNAEYIIDNEALQAKKQAFEELEQALEELGSMA